jgi:uncharacterized protein YqeY
MTLFEKINEGIKEAMKSRNQLRLDVLRMLKSKILVVDARGNLPDTEVVKLFKTYYGNLQETLESAITGNRPEIAERTKAELAIIQEFLPKTLSLDETREMVRQAISDSGAKSKKEVGLVMKCIMKGGRPIDAKLAKELADELLTD